MYVPGKLKDTGTVLVDVGTGFYIEKVISLVISYTGYKIHVCI